MITAFLCLLITSAFFVIAARDLVKMIIYLGVFSLFSSVLYLLLSAPDVAVAGAVTSAFSTIIFIVAFEKYHGFADMTRNKSVSFKKHIAPLCFTLLLFCLFVLFIPHNAANTYLKEQYTKLFSSDVGGENAVTAIYLGYRMYDTIFEALMLFVSIIAVVHLSWYEEAAITVGKPSCIPKSDISFYTIRIILPLLILFGIYLIMNGHISPGGGFHGGVMIAAFFVGRYMIYDIYDIRIGRAVTLEKLIYAGIIILAATFILSGIHALIPSLNATYLPIMNLLIGMKVACGFLIICYRFIALERM